MYFAKRIVLCCVVFRVMTLVTADLVWGSLWLWSIESPPTFRLISGVWVITQEIWQDRFYRKSVILTHAPVNYLNMTPDSKVGWGISIIQRGWRPYGWQHPLRMPWGRKRERSLIFTRLTVGLIFTRVSGSFGRTTRVSIGPPLLNVMDSWKLLKTENTRIKEHNKSCTLKIICFTGNIDMTKVDSDCTISSKVFPFLQMEYVDLWDPGTRSWGTA